jgi:hypothetical protein
MSGVEGQVGLFMWRIDAIVELDTRSFEVLCKSQMLFLKAIRSQLSKLLFEILQLA